MCLFIAIFGCLMPSCSEEHTDKHKKHKPLQIISRNDILCFSNNKEGQNYIIKRILTRTGASQSQWFVNRKAATQKQVNGILALNILMCFKYKIGSVNQSLVFRMVHGVSNREGISTGGRGIRI